MLGTIYFQGYQRKYPSLWPSEIGAYFGRNRLRVRVLTVSETYPMFMEPTITRVFQGFLGIVHMARYKNV